jgi:predicted glycosyltransferase involved in capsule biosynthesis
MKVSVVVPVRIDSHLLSKYYFHLGCCAKALELAVSEEEAEVVILDYGSFDYWAEVIKKEALSRHDLSFRYIRTAADKWSRAAALNRGIEAATGELILVIDADVIVPRNYVQSHREALATPGVYTNNPVYHLDKGHPTSWQHEKLVGLPGKVCPGGWSHCGFRKSDWEKAGGYNEDYYGWGGEDDDFLRRLHGIGLKREMLGCVPVHLWHEEYIKIQQQLGSKDLAESAERNYQMFHAGDKEGK